MFDLSGKKALITGATGGIGEAIARVFYAAGAVLALTGTRAEKLSAVSESLGERSFIFPCDLSNRSETEALIPAVEAQLGQVDILVNNAGVTRDALLVRMKDSEWDSVLELNLRAAFQLMRVCVKGMMRRRYGRIINVSSVVGAMGNAGQANYAAAKGGLVGLTKSVAREVASRHVTVNVLAPGFIETPMTAVLDDKQRGRILETVPCGRLGQPEDIAYAALFLASAEAAYITGQALHINGGMLMV